MLDIRIKFNKRDLAKIDEMPGEFKKASEKAVRKATLYIEGMSKRDFEKSRSAAGGLHARTGHLRRSITSGVKVLGSSIVGWIGSDVIYARIHELGGTIRPRAGKYLRFQISGQWKTVRQALIPQRPFLEPAIEENMKTIKNIIQNSIVKEVNR